MPPIGQIIQSFQRPFTLLRRDAPTIDAAGHAYPSPVTASTLRGAIYPQEGDKLQDVPEGLRDRAAIWIFTRAALRTAEDPNLHDADLVRYLNRLYRVFRSERWDFGGYYRSTALKLPQEAGYLPMHFGAGVTGLTPTQVEALPGLLYASSNDARVAVTAIADQFVYFAAPASFGTLSVDGVAGAVTNITIGTQAYHLFQSTAAALGAVTARFF